MRAREPPLSPITDVPVLRRIRCDLRVKRTHGTDLLKQSGMMTAARRGSGFSGVDSFMPANGGIMLQSSALGFTSLSAVILARGVVFRSFRIASI